MKTIIIQLIILFIPVILFGQQAADTLSNSEGVPETTNKAEEREVYSLVDNLKAGFASWSEQLDFVKQGGHKGVLDSSDLSLVSFTRIEAGEHPALEEFKEMPVSVIGRSNENGVPVIQKIREKWRGAKYYRTLKAGIINYYDSLEVDPRLHLVQLEWKYQDSTFHTYCVVSEALDVFIYDDILSNIFIMAKSRGRDVARHTEDASVNGDDYIFEEVLTIQSPIGVMLAQTSATIKVGRKKDGDALFILDYACDNKFKSMPFWDATGKSNMVSFKKGKDGHGDFAYELGVKYGSAVLGGAGVSGASWGTSSSISVSPSTSTVQ